MPTYSWPRKCAQMLVCCLILCVTNNYAHCLHLIHSPTKGGFKGDFFAVNNFVTPPDPEASAITNTQKFLSERLTNCANYNGKRPNFVYVDFWSKGVTSQLVQYANKQMAAQKKEKEQK